MPLTRSELRELLKNLLVSDADFDAFVGDHFPDVRRRFGDGMDRVRKTNILLEHAPLDRLEEEVQKLDKPAQPAGYSPAGGRLKILVLASNPLATKEIDLTREVRQIEARINGVKSREALTIVPYHAVRPSDLQPLLLQERPQVLHFSSHGSMGTGLLLEDDRGNVAPVQKKALVDMIGMFNEHIQLVVLNACDTDLLARALVQHVACAIGMRTSISDAASIVFAASLYGALALGEPVKTAFRLACNALDLERMPEAKIPTLRVKPGVDATTLMLRSG